MVLPRNNREFRISRLQAVCSDRVFAPEGSERGRR